jgi:uncharacterized protein
MRRAAFLSLPALCVWLAASCRTASPPENYLPVSKGTGGRSGGPNSSSGGDGLGVGGSAVLGGEGGELPGAGGSSSGSGAAPAHNAGGSGDPGPGSGGGPSASGGGEPGSSGGAAPVSDCQLPTASSADFSRQELRKAAAACASWAACEFEFAARALPQEIDVDAPNGAHAKQAWRHAMLRWSWLEAMQFGPTATPSEVQGRDTYQGRGLRDLIYAWPQVSRCRVDEQVAGKRYETFGMGVVPISARGLYGLETLLYYQGADTACTPNSTTGERWALLNPSELPGLRHSYARALARDVYDQAVALNDIWSEAGENFGAKYEAAEGYPSEQEAMNVLGWALLYVEREVKDYKLGIPAGFTMGAPVTEPEAEYSGLETELLRANVAGFRAIFQGCSASNGGIGFDDWLVEAGHPELAADILNATDLLQQRLATLPPFSELTPLQLEETYLAAKTLTDFLKGDLFGAGSPLNLKLPAGLEGDTD